MGRKTKGTLYKRGKTWCLLYHVNGKRFRVTLKDESGSGIANKKAAERAAEAILLPLQLSDKAQQRRQVAEALRTAEDAAEAAARSADESRRLKEAERNRLAIADAWERFPYTESTRGAVTRALSPGTVRDNRSHWQTFASWAEELGIQAVEDITGEHVVSFSRYLRDRMTANRHNKIIFTCSVICRLAGRPDPFQAAKRYRVEPVHRENLEPSDVRTVIGAVSGELRRLFIIATFTGLRLKDCVTLQWSDVHLRDADGRIIRRMAKTGRTVRFPLHPELRDELERTPVGERQGAVCPELADAYAKDSARVSKMTREIFEECGLSTRASDKAGRRNVASVRGFHSFRHTFATECARAGVPLGLVKEWLGHSSPEITRIYENWSMDKDAERVLEALPSLSEGPNAGEQATLTWGGERERLISLIGLLPDNRVGELLAMAERWAQR